MEIKFTSPSRYTPGDYGTICKVENDGHTDLYMQISDEPNIYNWIRVGDILVKCFNDFLSNRDFSPLMLDLYLEKQPSLVILPKLGEILLKHNS